MFLYSKATNTCQRLCVVWLKIYFHFIHSYGFPWGCVTFKIHRFVNQNENSFPGFTLQSSPERSGIGRFGIYIMYVMLCTLCVVEGKEIGNAWSNGLSHFIQ